MSNRKIRTQSDWQRHEDYVASLYVALGYKVTKDINIDGKQTDLICQKWIPGAGNSILYIDCKHTACGEISSISNADVEAFIATFHTRKNLKGWTYGILVSNQPFSQHAKATAAPHYDIILKTISELEEDIFLIRHYLHEIIRHTDDEALIADYIPLLATDIDQNLLPTGNPGSLMNFVASWLNESNTSQLCILGDFGSGKTTFLRFLHYHIAKLEVDPGIRTVV